MTRIPPGVSPAAPVFGSTAAFLGFRYSRPPCPSALSSVIEISGLSWHFFSNTIMMWRLTVGSPLFSCKMENGFSVFNKRRRLHEGIVI